MSIFFIVLVGNYLVITHCYSSHSGKDGNKLAKTKLHVVFKNGLPCFKEAKLILICKKIYKSKIKKEGFIDKTIIKEFYSGSSLYNTSSWHNVYVGAVLKAYSK